MLEESSKKEKLRLLTIEEVCKLFNVKESKIRRAIHKKEIPYLKIGGLIRFREIELENFLNNCSKQNIERKGEVL